MQNLCDVIMTMKIGFFTAFFDISAVVMIATTSSAAAIVTESQP